MSYAPVPDATKVAILRALAEPGARLDRVAVDLQLSAEIVRRVSSAHGFPDRHKMSWAADVIAKGRDVVDDALVVESTPSPVASATTAASADDTARLPARAGKSARARTRALAKRIDDDLARLHELVTAESEEKKAAAEAAATRAKEKAEREREQKRLRAEAAALEAKLAKVRAQLQRSAAVPPGAAALGLDPKAVRRWAAANGVACTATGRVPKVVVEAYLAAHGGAS